MNENTLVVDFETRWDSKEYTLSKMTTEEYVRDKRFTAFGIGVKTYGKDDARWITGCDIRDWAESVDWSVTSVLAHNAQFDVSILSWVYGVEPLFIYDSLSMARALRGVEAGNSLAKLAEIYGLPAKGKAVNNTNGMTRLTEEIEQELADYCLHDVFLCEEVFNRLNAEVEGGYPESELRLIDMTLKMFTEPVLRLDAEMLSEAIEDEKDKREGLLAKLEIEEASLASNQQFAEVLLAIGVEPPRKISKTTGKEAYAFAKNDALFQALLNSDNEEISLLCEARLKVKSTLERTRAQRFLDIAGRGALPVPLNYYGAHTGRWSASKGSSLNLQNLKRGSFLRKSIQAPQGYKLVVADLAQIEPRVLAYLADYKELLDIFASGQDAYAAFGAQMFGIPDLTKESHPDLRQSAKSALLGCFGAETKVLTPRGWVPIISVKVTDLLWDGEEWVKHQGLVPQGEKEVLTSYGVSATADHEILTEHGWREWHEVTTSPFLLKSALSSASLPVGSGFGTTGAITPLCGARAGGRERLTGITSFAGRPLGVIRALKESLLRLVGKRKGILQCAQTTPTEGGFSIGLAPLLAGAQTSHPQSTLTTGDAVLRYIRRGCQIAWRFLSTLCHSTVGILRTSNLTVSTTTEGMSPTTFAFAHGVQTWQTSARSKREMSNSLNDASLPLKQKMQTYDIAYAGERNRYTVLTDAGALVVHNCGYGMGWASFSAQLLTGFLGAPPTMYSKDFAKRLGVSGADVRWFLENESRLHTLGDIPTRYELKQILTHSSAARKIITKYREAAWPVVSLWEMCDGLIQRSLVKGKSYTYKCLTFDKERILLPSGLSLKYPDIRAVDSDAIGRVQWVYGEHKKKLYGGKLVENIVQAVARCVMTDGMLRIQERYKCVLTVHDECCIICPEDEAEDAYKFVVECMTADPWYMPGIPLAADGGFGDRYGDIK